MVDNNTALYTRFDPERPAKDYLWLGGGGNESTHYESLTTGNISAARTNTTDNWQEAAWRGGFNSDNGFGATGFADSDIPPEEAEGYLERSFSTARGKDISQRVQRPAAAAASALLTMEGVAYRAAGDCVIIAIGDNGQVISVLDDPSQASGDTLHNSLTQGRDTSKFDASGFREWTNLSAHLGNPGRIRIVAITDGVCNNYKFLNVGEFDDYIGSLLNEDWIDFDHLEYAREFVKLVSAQHARYAKGDDLAAVSAIQPVSDIEQAALTIIDGAGPNHKFAAECADKMVRELAGRDFFRSGCLFVPVAYQTRRAEHKPPEQADPEEYVGDDLTMQKLVRRNSSLPGHNVVTGESIKGEPLEINAAENAVTIGEKTYYPHSHAYDGAERWANPSYNSPDSAPNTLGG